MSYKLARLAFVLLIAFSLTNAGFAGQDDSSKSKKKPKNSDVENIGSRDINKGNILPLMSLEKEIALGQQIAAEVELQRLGTSGRTRVGSAGERPHDHPGGLRNL